MTCGVYLITCVESGRQYVGASDCVESRWRQHTACLRSGSHSNHRIQSEFAVYGLTKFVFQVLEECEAEDLNARESWWQEYLSAELSAPIAHPKNSRERAGIANKAHSLARKEWLKSINCKSVRDAEAKGRNYGEFERQEYSILRRIYSESDDVQVKHVIQSYLASQDLAIASTTRIAS